MNINIVARFLLKVLNLKLGNERLRFHQHQRLRIEIKTY